MNRPKPLAEVLAKAREKAGYSQVSLAEALGVSAGTVGGWEAGNHWIEPDRIPQVAKLVGLEVADLLTPELARLFAKLGLVA